MKRILTAALTAVIFTLFLGLTVYAAPIDEPEPDPTTPTGIESPTDEAGNPFTPAGSGTVTDYATDGDGKEFYTITTPDEMVFYLIIDRQRDTDNVYFLNAVTVDDLMSLAAQPKTPQGGSVVTAPTPAPVGETPAEPTPAPQQEQSGNNTGTLIIILALAIIGGGAAWYFKVYKPKQQGAGMSEYEPPAPEDTDLDDWDEDGEESTDGDAPPWDEESEGTDE
jgi:hypothetical protein